jgi:hypothetical protein
MSTENPKPAESDNKLTQRAGQLFSISAMPAAAISTIGDIFGPKGGWLFVGVLGFLSILLAVYLLMSLSISDSDKRPFWYRWTSNDKELSWIWTSKPALLSHGVHVVALFGVLCLFSAGKTYASLEDGGYLGKNIDAVAAAQKQLGLTQLQIELQKKTNEELSSLNKQATNFKKEVSDDPRKELANLGLSWSNENFSKAVKNSDLKTTKLYLAGGMPVSETDVVEALGNSQSGKEISVAIAQYAGQFDKSRCTALFARLSFENVAKVSDEGRSLVVALCKSRENVAHVEMLSAKAENQISVEKQRQEAAKRERKTPQACFSDEFGKNGEKILSEAEDYSLMKMINKTSIGPREEMLAKLNIAMSTNLLVSNGAQIVREYCEEKSKAVEGGPIDSREFNKWSTIKRWLS